MGYLMFGAIFISLFFALWLLLEWWLGHEEEKAN